MSALLIDIGNSRIKFACVKDGAKTLCIKVTESVEDLIAPIQSVSRVLLACVGSKVQKSQIEAACLYAKVPMQLIETQPSQFGIQCAYTEYKNMGVDRWLAILAVRQKTTSPAAIISIGTAITCDFIVDNAHLGGWIAPGFELMRDTVSQNTRNVFSNQQIPGALALGQSTQDCVNYGCMAAIQGAVILAEKQIASYDSGYKLFISGGAQSLARECVSENWSFEESLVLQGLMRFL